MGSGSSKNSDSGSNNNLKLSKKDLQYFIKEVHNHEKGINTMCISPNGSVIVTGSEDCNAQIYDTEREEVVSVLKGHEFYINHVICTDTYVFTASADKCIRKWRIDNGMCSKTMKGHTAAVNRLLIVETILFSSSYDRTIRCWDVISGECKASYTGHKLGVYPLLYIPLPGEPFDKDYSDLENNNDILISGSVDKTAKSWALGSRETIITFRGHTGAVLCLAADNQAKYLYTGSQDTTIRSFNLFTGEKLKVFEGHVAGVLQLQV